MHVLVFCMAVFRSHGELTVLNILTLKGICVLPLLFFFFIHFITQITIIQGRLQLLNEYELHCIFLLVSSETIFVH